MLKREEWLFLYAILASIWTVCLSDLERIIDSVDYCESETFEPRCQDNEVIVISSAKYGRMALGRCVSQNYGHVGCTVDVLDVLDDLCSGRQTCSIRANHHFLLAAKARACPKDVSAYLKVTYSCTQVIQGDENTCTKQAHISLESSSGYISSHTVQPSEIGSKTCPWVIRPPPGQSLNFTLYKFASMTDDSRSSSACFEVAGIKDNQENKNIISCGRDQRVKSVYVTQGERIEVSFGDKNVVDKLGHFLLYFQVASCGDPEIPSQTHFVRVNETYGKVNCNRSRDTWDIFCIAGNWEQPSSNTYGKCKPVSVWTVSGTSDEETAQGGILIVAIGAVIGMVVGGILLCIAITIFKRCLLCIRIRCMKRVPSPSIMVDPAGEIDFSNNLKPISEIEDPEDGTQTITEIEAERRPLQNKRVSRVPSKAGPRNGTLARVAVEYRVPLRREARASYHAGSTSRDANDPDNGTLPQGPGSKYQSKTLSRVPKPTRYNGNGTIPRSPKASSQDVPLPRGPITVHNFGYGTPPRSPRSKINGNYSPKSSVPSSAASTLSREHYAKINRPLPPTPDSDHDYETPVHNHLPTEECQSNGSKSTLNDSSNYANRSTDESGSGNDNRSGGGTLKSSSSSDEPTCTCSLGQLNDEDLPAPPPELLQTPVIEDERPMYANHMTHEDSPIHSPTPKQADTNCKAKKHIQEDDRPVYANHMGSLPKEEKERNSSISDDRPVYANHMGSLPKEDKSKTDTKDKKPLIDDDRPVYANHMGSLPKEEKKSSLNDDRPVYANHMGSLPKDEKNKTESKDKNPGTDDDRPVYANHMGSLPKDDKSKTVIDDRPVYANHVGSLPKEKTTPEKKTIIEDDRPVYANHVAKDDRKKNDIKLSTFSGVF